jgi:hypothetical protein
MKKKLQNPLQNNGTSQELADGSNTIKAILRPIVGHTAPQECLLHNSIEQHPLVCGEFVLEVEVPLVHL